MADQCPDPPPPTEKTSTCNAPPTDPTMEAPPAKPAPTQQKRTDRSKGSTRSAAAERTLHCTSTIHPNHTTSTTKRQHATVKGPTDGTTTVTPTRTPTAARRTTSNEPTSKLSGQDHYMVSPNSRPTMMSKDTPPDGKVKRMRRNPSRTEGREKKRGFSKIRLPRFGFLSLSLFC